MTRITVKKIICWNCKVEILQKYDSRYKGKRGQCPVCGVNFPLE